MVDGSGEGSEEAVNGDTFVLTINVGGDAFHPEPVPELERLLVHVVGKLRGGKLEGTIRDRNGNTCGLFGFEPNTENAEELAHKGRPDE